MCVLSSWTHAAHISFSVAIILSHIPELLHLTLFNKNQSQTLQARQFTQPVLSTLPRCNDATMLKAALDKLHDFQIDSSHSLASRLISRAGRSVAAAQES